MEASTPQSVQITGLDDEDSSIIWLAELCHTNQVQLESLVRQAEQARDPELAEFFRRTHALSQRLSTAA